MKETKEVKIQFRDRLNKISPSFCAAKWNQVTLHLQIGHTHSCHHPGTHKIPVGELHNNPGALHNTSYKKLQRKMMLEGTRPSECGYCWKIEDSAPDTLSDRTFKSMSQWASPYIDRITALPWDHNVVPTYLEVSFSSVCNFKCSYCGPQISSKWMEESDRYGPYPTSTQFGGTEWLKKTDAMPILHKDENPYVDAFWQWWPEIYTKLIHFRVTGGEPLLTKDTFRVLDYVIENPNPNLHLSINTNMCPPGPLLDKFIEKIKIICNENKVKQFKIFTSADNYGSRAEYIRDGMDYGMWLANIRRVLTEVPGCTFGLMSTFNALSVHGYGQMLKDVLDIKMDFTTPYTKMSPMIIDIPYLRHPEHQAVFILPREIQDHIQAHIDFMQANVENPHTHPFKGFFQFEVDRLKGVYNLAVNEGAPENIDVHRRDFVKFVDEHDRRRGTNFAETFPELVEFYSTIKRDMQ